MKKEDEEEDEMLNYDELSKSRQMHKSVEYQPAHININIQNLTKDSMRILDEDKQHKILKETKGSWYQKGKWISNLVSTRLNQFKDKIANFKLYQT